MNTTDLHMIVALIVAILLILSMFLYQMMYGLCYPINMHRLLLPGSPFIDVIKLDMTRSEKGVPITETVVDFQ